MKPHEIQKSLLMMLNGAEGLLLGASQLAEVFETFLTDAEQGQHLRPEQIAFYRRECAKAREAMVPMQGVIETQRQRLGRRRSH